MNVGERVRIVRKDKKMNQTEFGEGVGLSAAGISLIEKGTTRATERTIRDICRVYSVSYEWLTDGTGEMYERPVESKEMLVLSFSEIISEYPAVYEVVKQAAAHMTADDWKRVNELLSLIGG